MDKMSEFGECRECITRNRDHSKKELHECLHCKGSFCVEHVDAKCVHIPYLKADSKYAKLVSSMRQDWEIKGGHPYFQYTYAYFESVVGTDKNSDARRIKRVLDDMRGVTPWWKKRKREWKVETGYETPSEFLYPPYYSRKQKRKYHFSIKNFLKNLGKVVLGIIFTLLLGLAIVGTGSTGLKGEITSPIKRKSYYPRKHKSKSRLIKGIMVFVLIIIFIGGLYHHRNFVISSFSEALKALPVVSVPTPTVEDVEKEAFRLINQAREQEGLHPTEWDEELYKLSKAHTQEMANQGKLFHTPMGASYAENCWGGEGYYKYSMQELARAIVDSWISSPLHKAWILHGPIRRSVISIVITPTGQYASWTFWMSEVGDGPPLVRELSNKWMQETGGSIPWIDWLKIKGYLPS